MGIARLYVRPKGRSATYERRPAISHLKMTRTSGRLQFIIFIKSNSPSLFLHTSFDCDLVILQRDALWESHIGKRVRRGERSERSGNVLWTCKVQLACYMKGLRLCHNNQESWVSKLTREVRSQKSSRFSTAKIRVSTSFHFR